MILPTTIKPQEPISPWSIFDLILRLGLSGLFLVSGAVKLAAPQTFAVIIDAYGIVPELLVMPVALMLPVLEIVAAVGLIMDARGSLALMTLLMLIFISVLAYGIYLGLDVDCGCFGPGDPEAEAFHGLRSALYRDIVIVLCLFYLFYRRHRPKRGSLGRVRPDSRRK